MAYLAITVYGQSFQTVLLASELFYLTQAMVELASSHPILIQNWVGWLTVCHNPLLTFVYQLIRPANYQMEVNKVWALPRSLATTNGIVVYFLFLRVLRCFSSPAYRCITYEFSYTPCNITCMRFPHSDIYGSKLVGSSPQLFAANCVLHRCLMSRHPLCALE